MELEAAMTYANALYGAASDLGHISEVREEICEISRLTRDEKEFGDLLTNPGMAKEKKKAMAQVPMGWHQGSLLMYVILGIMFLMALLVEFLMPYLNAAALR